MTSTNVPLEVLKQDVGGRVLVPAGRREALLDEFERSGVSGAKFARLVLPFGAEQRSLDLLLTSWHNREV